MWKMNNKVKTITYKSLCCFLWMCVCGVHIKYNLLICGFLPEIEHISYICEQSIIKSIHRVQMWIVHMIKILFKWFIKFIGYLEEIEIKRKSKTQNGRENVFKQSFSVHSFRFLCLYRPYIHTTSIALILIRCRLKRLTTVVSFNDIFKKLSSGK